MTKYGEFFSSQTTGACFERTCLIALPHRRSAGMSPRRCSSSKLNNKDVRSYFLRNRSVCGFEWSLKACMWNKHYAWRFGRAWRTTRVSSFSRESTSSSTTRKRQAYSRFPLEKQRNSSIADAVRLFPVEYTPTTPFHMPLRAWLMLR